MFSFDAKRRDLVRNQFVRDATGPLDVDALKLLAARARLVAGAQLAVLALADRDHDELVLEIADGELADGLIDDLPGFRIPVRASVAGDVYRTGTARVLDSLAEASLHRSPDTFRRLSRTISSLGPAVLVPLAAPARPPVGVLTVARDRGAAPFDAVDVQQVRGYAGHAALTIEFATADHDRQRLAVLEERDRIARDLHDLVIQRLFAIGLGLQGLVRGDVQPDTAEHIRDFTNDIDQTIRDLRRSIYLLQQEPEAAQSLRGELFHTVSDATASLGYEPTVSLDGPLDSVVPPHVRLDLIATLRETLSNVVRHADARRVSVTVTVDRAGHALRLTVQDDGSGLPPGLAHRSGLANIAERAARLHGRCLVDSPAGGGTRVDWTVPLRGEPEPVEPARMEVVR